MRLISVTQHKHKLSLSRFHQPRIEPHAVHQLHRIVRHVAGGRNVLGHIELGVAVHIERVGQRVAEQARIELLDDVGQREVRPPGVLAADAPGDAAILDQHLPEGGRIGGRGAGERVADGGDDVNVAWTGFDRGYK